MHFEVVVFTFDVAVQRGSHGSLRRAGHDPEAKAAIAFQMGASVGQYEMYVGAPYQISVVRYYGDGTEWSDSNSNGPNVEFDGFGLFLWELAEYVRASGDTASLTAWWPARTTLSCPCRPTP